MPAALNLRIKQKKKTKKLKIKKGLENIVL